MNFAAASLPEALPGDQLLRRRIPAWLLSLMLHLVAILLGSLLVRGTQLPSESEEPSRRAAIVLARPAVEKQTHYLSQEDHLRAALVDGVVAEAVTETPAADVPSFSSSVKLPELPGPINSGGEGLIIRPRPAAASARRFSLLTAADKAAIQAEDAARPRASKPTGPTTRLSLFNSAEAEGRSFVFVIDRSQSMGAGGLGVIEAAANELATSIERLEETHSFQVIAYNQKPRYLSGRELIAATPGNKKQLLEFVKNLPAFGATEHEIGIFAALKLKPDAIFLLTDGGDPHLSAGQLQAIRRAAGETAIHCLHFGSGPRGAERSFLETLAEQTRGSYLYIDMPQRQ